MSLYKDPYQVLLDIVGENNNLTLTKEDYEFVNPIPATPPPDSTASYNTKVTIKSKTAAAPFVGQKEIYYNRLDLADLAKMVSLYVNDINLNPIGQRLYDTPGTHEWVVPEHVTEISAVCVGGGGASGLSRSSSHDAGGGGGGGGLRWIKTIPVTPGETLEIEVGVGGKSRPASDFPLNGDPGGKTLIKRASVVLLMADGGNGGGSDGSGVGGAGGGGTAISGDVGGGNGGRGGYGGYYDRGGAGGGAGGYSGNGGNGGSDGDHGSTGLGGAGGGGDGGSYGGGGGGGVGIYGQGSSGSVSNTSTGAGGYGGSNGTSGENAWPHSSDVRSKGGVYGGGGGSGNWNHNIPSGAGGDGAVRLVWGPNRNYPATDTSDKFDSTLFVKSPVVDTTHDILPSLNKRFGLGLQESDIVLKTNVASDGYKTANLEATPDSLGWYGSVEVLALTGDLKIEDHLLNTTLEGISYPTDNLQLPFAQFYSFWRDFSGHHDALLNVQLDTSDKTPIATALSAVTGHPWTTTGTGEYSLEDSVIVFNGPALNYGNVNIDYEYVMVVSLDPIKNTGMSGDLVIHYNEPFDPMEV